MIILDTHIWLWWLNNDVKLKQIWLDHIQDARIVAVSAISLFEVSWLDAHGRISLSDNRLKWFDYALKGSGIELVAISPEIASLAVDLSEHHSDPQDRLIIATAIVNNARLLSADGKFKHYRELGSLLIQ